MKRRFAHVRLAGLGVDRLLREQALADGIPAATVAPVRGRPVVIARNRAAAAAGVAVNQQLADARALCATLVVASVDPEADRRSLLALVEQCQRIAPWVGIDRDTGAHGHGLFLDITGCSHLYGGEDGMVRALSRLLARGAIRGRIAIADTPGAAWAWSHSGRRQSPILAPGEQEHALASLPVAALRLPDRDAQTLERLGILSIGALSAIPRHALRMRFGPGIGQRLDQAAGREPEPIEPLPPRSPMAAWADFAEPMVAPEGVVATLRGLLPRLALRLARELAGARRLELSVRRVDGSRDVARIGTARATRDVSHLAGLFAPAIERIDPSPGIERIWLEAIEVELLDGQPKPRRPGRDGGAGSRQGNSGHLAWRMAEGDALATLIDRLVSRLGADRVLRPALRESHLPEEQSEYRRAIDAPDGSPSPACGSAQADRPVRLFRRPEPIRFPAASHGSAAGPPSGFFWRGAFRRLSRIGDCERVIGPWWRSPPVADEIRDYFRVETESGERLWLVRSGDEAVRWSVHGIFG